MSRAAPTILALALVASHAACQPYSDKAHREALEAPEHYPSAGGEGGLREGGEAEPTEGQQRAEEERAVREWETALPTYETFEDPVLVRLIRHALESSPDVATTLARIRLARAMADQARAARMPVVMASGVAQRSSIIQGALGRVELSSISVNVPIQWELDLYGRFASEHRAAKDMARASELDFEAMQISLTASVTEAYMDLVGVRAERNLIDEQLETNESYLELVKLRFETGLASAVDVHQQRQQVVSLEAQRDLLDGEESVAINSLLLILGELEAQVDVGTRDTLPEIGEPPPQGVPASLFERRPDLRAAALRIEANDKRVRAAITAQLPSVRVEFTPGYVSQRAEAEIFGGPNTASGFQWTASAAMDVAIFDGLLGPATANARRAEVDEAVALYRQTFQNALVEVENAVVLDRQQRQAIRNLEKQVEYASDTLEAARDRYQAGLSDFLPVLTALRTKQAAEQGLLTAERNLVRLRVQLYRALGGVLEADDE